MDPSRLLMELTGKSELSHFKSQLLNYGWKILIVTVLIIAARFIILYFKKFVVNIMIKSRMDKAIANLFSSAMTFIGWVITIAVIFKILGFTEISLAFSGSLALIAMGLASAASGIVGDLFSGVSLITDNYLKVGCKITVMGITGRVISIDIRKTRIMDDQGNIHVIPNRSIDNAVFSVARADQEEPQAK